MSCAQHRKARESLPLTLIVQAVYSRATCDKFIILDFANISRGGLKLSRQANDSNVTQAVGLAIGFSFSGKISD